MTTLPFEKYSYLIHTTLVIYFFFLDLFFLLFEEMAFLWFIMLMGIVCFGIARYIVRSFGIRRNENIACYVTLGVTNQFSYSVQFAFLLCLNEQGDAFANNDDISFMASNCIFFGLLASLSFKFASLHMNHFHLTRFTNMCYFSLLS
ncbi:putative ribosomal protein L5 [Helianthus anomalus]